MYNPLSRRKTAALPSSVRAALQPSPATQRGAGLTELLLVAAGTAIGIATIYGVYLTVDAAERVNRESSHVVSIADHVLADSASDTDFSGVSQERSLTDQIFPSDMIDANGEAINAWGGSVSTVATPTPTGVGFAINFFGVPQSACSKLAASSGRGFFDVQVNGTSVLASDSTVDITAASRLCAQSDPTNGALVSFIEEPPLVTAVPPATPVCVPPGPLTGHQTLPCPPGQIGLITQTDLTTYTCVTPAGPVTSSTTPWTTTSNTCTPICGAAPSPASQTLTCPPGQSGSIVQSHGWSAAPSPVCWTADSWSTTSNTCSPVCGPAPAPASQTLTCPPGQSGSIVQSHGWSAAPSPVCWTADSWSTTSNTCSPVCGPAPAPGSGTLACPPGQSGSIIETGTWAAAPAPTCWTETWTSSSSCAPNCVPASPATQTQCAGPTVSVTCPPGQSGTNSYELVEQRTSSCPAPTGAAVWSAWINTSTQCNIVDTCAPNCIPAPTQTQCAGPTTSVACPPGQSGTSTYQLEEQRTSSCPTPTGAAVWAPWTNIAPSTQCNVVNTCAPTCVPVSPATQIQCAGQVTAVACPPGQSGTNTYQLEEQRTSSCPAPTGPASWSPWANIAPSTQCNVVNTCAPICVPAPTQTQCAGPTTSVACPPGQAGTHTYQLEEQRTSSCPAPTGPASWSAWTNIAPATQCNVVNTCAPVCGAAPPPASQTVNCVAPAVGTWTQTHGWSSAAYPTCWTAQAWAPPSAPAGACVTPPPVCPPSSAPATTPACSGGGNQSGGTWSESAYPGCTWSYAGGTCPPPAPAVITGEQTCVTSPFGACATGQHETISGGNVWPSPLGCSYKSTITYNGSTQTCTASGLGSATTTCAVGGKNFTVSVSGSAANNCPAANPAFAGNCTATCVGSGP